MTGSVVPHTGYASELLIVWGRKGYCRPPAAGLRTSIKSMIKTQICACYDHAVNAVAQQLCNSDLGTCAVLVDAECNDQYQSFPDAFLPASMQMLAPRHNILHNVHADFAALLSSCRHDWVTLFIWLNLVSLKTSSCMLHRPRSMSSMLSFAAICNRWATLDVRQHEISNRSLQP